MKYFKIIENDCIVAIGIDIGGVEIAEEEYNSLLEKIKTKPNRRDGYDYKLKTDLSWEECENKDLPA